MQKVSHSPVIHTKAIINPVHLYLCSGVTCSFNSSCYGYIHYWGITICHNVQNELIMMWWGIFQALTSPQRERQDMWFHWWSTCHVSLTISPSQFPWTEESTLIMRTYHLLHKTNSLHLLMALHPTKQVSLQQTPASLFPKKYTPFNEIVKPSS